MHKGLIHGGRTIIIVIIILNVSHGVKKKASPVRKGFYISWILSYNNSLPQFELFKLLLKLLLLLFKITLWFFLLQKVNLLNF